MARLSRFLLSVPLCAVCIAHVAPLLELQNLDQPPREQPPPGAVFHSGTRLVQVEVVVRGKQVPRPGVVGFLRYAFDDGPPFGAPGPLVKGLTKEDFMLLDNGKPQPIAVFHTSPLSEAQTFPIPAGAVSNRQDSRGKPVGGATAVLVDMFNADFDYTSYAGLGVKDLLRSLTASDSRVALYMLGEKLHILHDFADDPQELATIAAGLDKRNGKPSGALKVALGDIGDLMDLGAAEVHSQRTLRALKLIMEHLSGVAGRKNLVWLMDDPAKVPPGVIAVARQANIVVYPVLMRSTGNLDKQRAARDLASLTGATAFFDALDLTFAVHAAEEDVGAAYVLGYYPPEELLDGRYHKITVKLSDKPFEVHYRPGYLATTAAPAQPAPPPEALFQGPLNAAMIGLAAQATPDAQHPGLYDVKVTVDLHDIHMEMKDGHFTGGFYLSVPIPSAPGTVKTGTIALDLTGELYAEDLEKGFPGVVMGVASERGEIRVVVRDRATGIAGSLRVPAEAK